MVLNAVNSEEEFSLMIRRDFWQAKRTNSRMFIRKMFFASHSEVSDVREAMEVDLLAGGSCEKDSGNIMCERCAM